MVSTPDRTAAATARRKAGRHRGEGQWAAGHFTPLNGNEQLKKDDDGLNVRTRIETIYAHRGFDSIDPADLRGRMRWWGLYTQRRPGIDGGKTAVLEPEELDAYFVEFLDYLRDCRYLPCTHTHEPGCAVREAVERGDIDEGRYASYLAIFESLKKG